jgi:hypothetical protein
MIEANRCLVLTGYDDVMTLVGDITSKTHQAYALKYGFNFEVFKNYGYKAHPAFQKLELIKDRLDKYDLILWLDADMLVTNPDIDFRDLVGDRKGMIFSMDWNGKSDSMFSSGACITVCGPEAGEVIDDALRRKHWAWRPLWDQSALQEVCRAKLKQYFHILPRRKLNAVPIVVQPNSTEPWMPGDFTCHLTGIRNDMRLEILNKMIDAGELKI